MTADITTISANLCGFTYAAMAKVTAGDCSGTADTSTTPTVAVQGMAAGVWVIDVCYFMFLNRYFKITSCVSATSYTVL